MSQTSSEQLMAIIPLQEVCSCLACESQINAEHVLVDPSGVREAPRQVITAWCEHCNRVYQIHRRLANGVYQMLGRVVELHGRHAREAIARIERGKPSRKQTA